MMNKTKSAKLQVGRFLFLFPVLAIILLAFRKSFTDSTNAKINSPVVVFADTIPDVKVLNSKGYYIDIKDNNGNCMVVIKDKNKKEVKRLLLTEWNEKDDYYENLYGEILSPSTEIVEEKIKANNPAIRTVTVNGNTATVTLKNGKTETYTLFLKSGKKAFEERCGIKEVAIEPVELEEVKVAAVGSIKPVLTTEAELKEVTVAGAKSPAKISTTIKTVPAIEAELKEVTVTGVKTPARSSIITKSIPSIESELTEVTITGVKSPAPLTSTVAEQSLEVAEARILHLGGLTILDEGQYILLDGKEVGPESYGKLTGPYRIIFVDKKEAEKKYGVKAKNGAIILDTIR